MQGERGRIVSHIYNSEKAMDTSSTGWVVSRSVRKWVDPRLVGWPKPLEIKNPTVSIIVPARNEEVSLGDCLQSLVAQIGVTTEIIVVDDGSTDCTRKIAESVLGVKVVDAGPVEKGWTGKNNALRAGASKARGTWLLFTDADTVHLPDSLARAVAEAKRVAADLLSYSPEQVVQSFAERIVMPMVFAELATEYPPARVQDEKSGVVAANGQYILVRRKAYDFVHGHTLVAGEILEDVALAKAFRSSGLHVYFRYGGDAVRTRMYRNWAQLRDGWTKNLALLFTHPVRRAFKLTAWWLLAWITLPVPVLALKLYTRIERANFNWRNTLLATAFGAPVFSYLLLRSRLAYVRGKVSWKGRSYPIQPTNSFPDCRKLGTDN
jgi:glycosyltransferase involved in cell wall biosynthesis